MHLLLFDIDGTLIRGQGIGRLALERAFGEVFRVSVDEHPELKNVYFAGSTDPVIVADMARVLGIAEDEFAARKADLEAAYLRHLRVTAVESPMAASCPGVAELLPRLERHPELTLGLLTGNIEAGARTKLAAFDLEHHFSFGGFGGEAPERRDLAALAHRRASDRHGADIPSERVLVIGDTEADIDAGRTHGFLTVGVGTGWAPMETLRAAGADAVFEDLTPTSGFESWLEQRWGVVLEGDPV